MQGTGRHGDNGEESEIVVLLRRFVDIQEKLLRLAEEQAAARTGRRPAKTGTAPVIDELTARRAHAELMKRGLGGVQRPRKR